MPWHHEYKSKLRAADEALQCVQLGMRVYIQPGCAEPETLVEALMRRGPCVYDVEIVHTMTMGCPHRHCQTCGRFDRGRRGIADGNRWDSRRCASVLNGSQRSWCARRVGIPTGSSL